MITPTSILWKQSTPAQRNDACACFMPPSDVNPIRSWHLHIGDHDMGALTIQSQKEADDFISKLHSIPSDDWHTVSISKYCAWDKRETCKLFEHRRSVNYTTTPGGAWTLLDELMRQDYTITIIARDDARSIKAEPLMTDGPAIAFEGREPFAELTGMLFLAINGVKIIQ